MEIEDMNRIQAAAVNGIPKEKAAKTDEERDWYDRMVAANKRAKKRGVELDMGQE